MANDPFDLQRFVAAQNPEFEQVCFELREGSKFGHWMWFIFPQIAGLGHSPLAVHFAIASREEAQAYLAHEILGPRLIKCTALVNAIEGRSVDEIFGYPDNLKFRSSMTLFSQVAKDNLIFSEALAKYFDGNPDQRTLQLL